MAVQISPAPANASGRRTAAAAGVALVVIAGAALESFLLPALPHIQHEFGVDAATGALAQVAPTLTTVIVTPLAGRFADVYGAKRTLAALLVIVTAGGLTSAFAPIFSILVLGQVLQGFALGVLPVAFVVVRGLFTAGAIATASGGLVALTVGGAGLGVLIAGPLIENTSRAVLFGIPTAVVIIGGMIFFVSRARLALRAQDGPTRIDWAGACALSLTLIVTVVWLASTSSSGWLAPGSLLLLAVAVALTIAWVLIERRVAQPMIAVATLRSRAVGGAAAMGVGIGAAYASLVYLLPQQISQPADGYGLGASATQTGFFLTVAFAAGFVASPIAGRIAVRLGTRVVGAGAMLVLATGTFVATLSTEPAAIIAALAFAGIGAGSASTVAFSSATSGAVEHEVGVSTALVTIARAIGGAFATQVVASIISTSATAAGGVPDLSAFRIGLLIAMGVAIVGAVLALLLPKGSGRSLAPEPS
ncbi:MFS family permease [Microbacterium natoriense]|uniref:MFS family permease n=1 Tax=Microbacterium natoriense TaxID=284570 RepID=A0AAW8EZ00_9MICO|nr:MFS transporter [Microbacterium natoriense]MDQ0648034.1 MFS family permease [Microbacterium natoriense]